MNKGPSPAEKQNGHLRGNNKSADEGTAEALHLEVPLLVVTQCPDDHEPEVLIQHGKGCLDDDLSSDQDEDQDSEAEEFSKV